jgi:hypothetical protein
MVVYEQARKHSNECGSLVIAVNPARPHRSHVIFLPKKGGEK